MGSTVKAEPAPNPAAVNPAASPMRSGNHLRPLPVAVPYTMPASRPPAIAPTYNHARVLAHELITQASPTMIPPKPTINVGPKRSTRYASNDTNQVSVSTNKVNATWIAATPHLCCLSIGTTKSVHPYCRLAMATMPIIPTTSCSNRLWIKDTPGRATAGIGLVALADLIEFPPGVSNRVLRHCEPLLYFSSATLLTAKRELIKRGRLSPSLGGTLRPPSKQLPLAYENLAGDENGLVASTTNITSACSSVEPPLETCIGVPLPASD